MANLFGFFRRRPPERSTSRHVVRERPGPLTLYEAWALARPAVTGRDPSARLTLLTSGPDINQEGRSFAWDFGFELPRKQAYLLVTIEPSGEVEDIDSAPVVLEVRLTPDTSRSGPPRSVLPMPFRDSPDVVAELAAVGVDFVAGPGDMRLAGRVLPTGEAVWVIEDFGGEHTVPFAPSG